MATVRPVPLLVAVVSLGILGGGGLAGAAALVLAASEAEALDDHLGAIGGGVLLPVAGVALLVGLAALAAAAAVWARRSWGWLLGALVTGVIVAGTLVVVLTGGGEPPLVAGLALGAVGAAGLWWPATRAACRV